MESFAQEWISLRRGGGGGGDPIARPLSVMMMMLLPLAVLAHASGQNQMCAAMIVGIIFGACNLDAAGSNTALSPEVNVAFIELGEALVLFFAGLADADFEVMQNYAMPCLRVGSSKLVVITAVFAGIGYGSGLCDDVASTVVFGFACSLSSKKVMLRFLEDTGTQKSMHGRLLQGMAILQDAVLAVALVAMHAFKRSIILPPSTPLCNATTASAGPALAVAADCISAAGIASGNTSHANSTNASSAGRFSINYSQLPDSVPHNGSMVAVEVLRAFGIFSIVVLVLHRLKRYHILEKMFDFFAGDGEMLFIGTMSYALGACAVCYELRVSPMTGAYLAGVSLSQTSYRLQIEHKIDSLQTFGMTLFYFMLGTYVKLDAHFFRTKFALAALVSLLQLLVTPLCLLAVSYRAGLKSRTALYTSLLCNSMGESTLTLQVVAFQAGVINRNVFQVLVCSTLGSILLSNSAHPFLDRIYNRLKPLLEFMDKSSTEEEEREAKMPLQSHVVILGYCETGAAAADFFRMANRDVYVVDLDKPFHDLIKAAYKGTMPRVPPRVTTRTGIFGAEFLASQDGEQLGVQASVRIRLPTISRVDALDAGETNEGLNGIEPEGLNGIEPRLQSILSGAIPRADAAHADAARQTSDAQSLFLGFEDFARRVSNDGSDGGVGSSRRSVEMVSGSSFGGPNAPEVHSIASDASAQSLSHAGEQLQDRESLAIATASSVQTPSEDLESVRPSLSQGASACRQRDAALAAVARAMDAPDSVSTAAEQRTDLSKPGLVHPSIGGILRSSSTEREQSRGAAETDAVEADGTSAVARPRPQEIETTRANLDGGVRFYLRDSPRGEMERGDEKDRGRKSDESFGSSSKRPGLVRRSLDLVRTRRPEDPSTRAAGSRVLPRAGSLDLDDRRWSLDGRRSLDVRRNSSEYRYGGAMLRRSNCKVLETAPHESDFHVDGHMFGGQTNIISLYADPELEETWSKYGLRNAALVISCMNTRFQSNILLCKFMADTRVPVVVVCDTKDEAAALYGAGCTYVQQPVLTSANDLKEIFHEELVATKNMFANRALDHQDALDDEVNDVLRKQVSRFK